ncbi:MAG: N-acetylmuramoyl-L-alanine amidase [Prevotella sp.]|nr:N-acetylmuramoyl-L-alanine amidase [Prevotella sp.]
MKKLFITLILSILTTTSYISAKRFTLVIDPGHGGHDAGAIGAYSKEKDINLRTALAFGKYLERYCPEVNVIYTRKTDVFVTLHGRADIANKAKADLFISIHTNAAPSKPSSVRGMETYTLGMHRAADNLAVAKRENEVILQEKDYQTRYQGFDPNSSESYIIFEFMQDNNMHKSVELAKLVQRNVCSTATRPDKGVKQAGFLVLRETSMPSCLIELGFISTPSDEQLLNDDKRIDDIARGIYQAFAQYKNKYDNNIAIPYKPEEIEPMVVSQSNFRPAPTPQEPKPEVKPEAKPDVKPTPKSEAKNALVFKVQIFAVDHKLKASDARFKGRTDTDHYKEGGLVKYTIGESTDYNEMNRLRKELNNSFPGCFVIAFKDGEKMNINEAIQEFKRKRQ